VRALARISRPHLMALLALAIGLALCAATLVRAVRVEAAPPGARAGAPWAGGGRAAPDTLVVPEVPERGTANGDVAASGEGTGIGEAAIAATVDVDPFHPARTRPGARYVLGGVGPAAPVTAAAPRQPIPMLMLKGLVARPNGQGLAALSVNGRPAQIVRVGQTVESFRLTRVDARSATLTRSDTTLVIRLSGGPGQQ
jgi:hypothetical protein